MRTKIGEFLLNPNKANKRILITFLSAVFRIQNKLRRVNETTILDFLL